MSESWIGSDLPPIWRGGEEYFLLGHSGCLYLILNRCPHRGGPLKSGFINADGALVCPMHRGVFTLDGLVAQPTTIRLEEQAAP